MSEVLAAMPAITAALGCETQVGRVLVQARDFQRFAYAVGHLDPRFFEGNEPLAPPIYLPAVLGWGPGPSESDLRSDGSDPAPTNGLPLNGLRLMGVGQEIVFHAAVRDGMELDVAIGLESAVAREGRQGLMIVMTLRRVFSHSGEPVVTVLEKVIAR